MTDVLKFVGLFIAVVTLGSMAGYAFGRVGFVLYLGLLVVLAVIRALSRRRSSAERQS